MYLKHFSFYAKHPINGSLIIYYPIFNDGRANKNLQWNTRYGGYSGIGGMVGIVE